MKEIDKIQKLKDTLIVSILIVILMYIGIRFLPIIFIIFPIPLIVLGLKHGVKNIILSILISTVVVGALFDIVAVLFILMFTTALSIAIVYMVNKKIDSAKIIIFSSLITLIVLVLVLIVMVQIIGLDLTQTVEGYVDETVDVYTNYIKSINVSELEQNEIIDMIKLTASQMILLIPSTILLLSIFYSVINYAVGVNILNKIEFRYKEVPKFKNFLLPSNLFLGIFAMLIGTYVIKYLGMDHESILINIISILNFLFYVQGLAVVVYWLNKSRTNKFLTALLVVISIPFGFIISVVGFSDTIFNYRKLNKYKV